MPDLTKYLPQTARGRLPNAGRALGEQSAAPAFASAADTLRAKIRACAARSFAARRPDAGRTGGTADAGQDRETALAAGRQSRKIGPERRRAYF